MKIYVIILPEESENKFISTSQILFEREVSKIFNSNPFAKYNHTVELWENCELQASTDLYKIDKINSLFKCNIKV